MSGLLKFPPDPNEISVIVERGKTKYAPLISTALALYAEIEVLMFRSQPRGDVLTDGGDVDNRLKTLLDALRIPRGPIEGAASREGLFYCLLEDDSLVTKVSIETDQLLRPVDPTFVMAVIHVNIKKTRALWGNVAF
jgi:hypothetical protein